MYTNVFEKSDDGLRPFLTKSFLTMGAGLLLTAATAFLVGPYILSMGTMLNFVLLFGQLGIAMYFGGRLFQMSVKTARLCFFAYCVLTGINISYLPFIYGGSTLIYAFVSAAAVFGSMAIIGLTTRRNLLSFGTFFVGALIGLLIASVFNFFFRFETIDIIINYAGIFLFLGITAFDAQRLKAMYYSNDLGEDMQNKLGIYGAFELYLDFINLFLYILRMLGRSDD